MTDFLDSVKENLIHITDLRRSEDVISLICITKLEDVLTRKLVEKVRFFLFI